MPPNIHNGNIVQTSQDWLGTPTARSPKTEDGPEQREGIPSYNIPRGTTKTAIYQGAQNPQIKVTTTVAQKTEMITTEILTQEAGTATAVTMTTRKTLLTYGP